jgi:hypothetical protein
MTGSHILALNVTYVKSRPEDILSELLFWLVGSAGLEPTTLQARQEMVSDYGTGLPVVGRKL